MKIQFCSPIEYRVIHKLAEEFKEAWPNYIQIDTNKRIEQATEELPDEDFNHPKAKLKTLAKLYKGATGSILFTGTSPLTLLVEAMIANANDKTYITDEDVIDCKSYFQACMKHLDILFFCPLQEEDFEEESDVTEESFAQNYNTFFRAVQRSYENGTGAVFSLEDTAPFIPLEGPADMRVEQVRLYLKEDGTHYGEQDGSLINYV